MQATLERKLGTNQVEFMTLMRLHRGVWQRSSNWSWKAPSETLRMLAALQSRGYATYDKDTGKYLLTPAGRQALKVAEMHGLKAEDPRLHENLRVPRPRPPREQGDE